MRFLNKNQKVFPSNKTPFRDFKAGIITLIIISFFILNLSPISKGIKDFFYLMASPVQAWLWEKGSGIAGFFEIFLEMDRVKKENEDLKSENQELINKNIELEQLRRENEVLRTALDFGLKEDFELKLAQVIGKEISDDFLIIDKGFSDGIAFGFPVITQQKSLIGKVIQVYENVSKVQLLTSKDSSFDVEFFERETYGLAKGKGGFDLFIDLIPKEKEIKLADKVMTSALGGNFPQGLFVGEVVEIEKSDVTSFQKAEIKPVFNINELDHLFIITNFSL